MISIPFYLSDAYGGLAEADGTARFDGRVLSLEFIIKDAMFGVVTSAVKKVLLNPDDISSIHFKKSIFKGTIAVQAHSVESVSAVPGQKGGEVKLSIKRRHCPEAEEFVSTLRLAVSQSRLRRLEEIEEEHALERHERLKNRDRSAE